MQDVAIPVCNGRRIELLCRACEKARKDSISVVVGYGPGGGAAGVACLRVP